MRSEDNTNTQGGGNTPQVSFKFVFIVLAIALLPGTALGLFMFFICFKLLKWKPSISVIPYSIIAILATLTFIFSSKSILAIYIFVAIILGLIISYGFILNRAIKLKRYPELKLMNGWAHNFEFSQSPFEKRKRKKLIQQLSNGELYNEQAAPIGVLDEKVLVNKNEYFDKEVVVSRFYQDAFGHTLVTGQTGSGKTRTMLNLVKNDIITGKTVLYIDMKKGPDVIYFLSKWAAEHDRPFYHFISGKKGTYTNVYKPLSHSTYDPLASGTQDSKADAVLNLREWGDNVFYEMNTKSIITSVFYMLDHVDQSAITKIDWQRGGLNRFYSALDVEAIYQMIVWLEKDLQDRGENDPGYRMGVDRLGNLYHLYNALQGKGGRDNALKGQFDSLKVMISNLILSGYGEWLEKSENFSNIDLFDLFTSDNAPVILFSLSADQEPETAAMVGNILLSDVNRAASRKNEIHNTNPVGVYVDEFQTLNVDILNRMLQRVRSAKLFVTLASQSLDQIATESSGGQDTVQSMLDTCTNFIVHSGTTQDSAIRISKILGQTKQVQYKITSRFSADNDTPMIGKDIADVWVLEPSNIQSLSKPSPSNGYLVSAYYITKGGTADPLFSSISRSLARRVRVVIDEEITQDPPKTFTNKLFTNTKEVHRSGSNTPQASPKAVQQPAEQPKRNFGTTKIPQGNVSTTKVVQTKDKQTNNQSKINLPKPVSGVKPPKSLVQRKADKSFEELENMRKAATQNKKNRPKAADNQPKKKPTKATTETKEAKPTKPTLPKL